MKFQITISTVQEKKTSQYKDALRILAWNEFKTKYKEEISQYKSVLAFYQEVFDPLWKESPIMEMSFDEVVKYAASLGYSPEDLIELRSKNYQNKADAKLRFENKNKPQIEGSDF